MDEIESRVRAETDGLLLTRTRVLATVVLLGIVAGDAADFVLGRFLEFPYRRVVNLAGLIAMVTAICATYHPRLVGRPRHLAFGTAVAASVFLLVLSKDAGPRADTVMILAYTVLNLGTAILMPWGVRVQIAVAAVILACAHSSMLVLGRDPWLDPSEYIALLAGIGLSLFVASSLERARLMLVRQRFELAREKERAEAQAHLAERRKADVEALADDLDAYAHAVAHDLKNPLNLITGYSDMLTSKLEGRLEDDEARHFLDQTATGCKKMAQIIDALLLLASVRKIGAVPREPVQMGSVVAEACRRSSNLIDATGAEVEIPREWPQAVGYAPWLEEVWANYISNAVKYGGEHPKVQLGADPESSGKVHFWVRDSGPGLTEAQVSRLFREFSRETTGVDGHGLGLSIVKRIVEKLGGEVTVTSKPGEGSTFGFTLLPQRPRLTTSAGNRAEVCVPITVP